MSNFTPDFPIIKVIDVTKSYWDQTVLSGINLDVGKAETKVILGGSGSGKSTIVKLILGLEKPDSGQIFVDGEDIVPLKEEEMMRVRKKIGMVFQEGALFDSLTVGENVAYKLREEQIFNEEEVEAVVRRLLGFVDLEDAVDKMPAELSGGMRRRVAIARALVGNPKIMLYDEPTAGLDPITMRTICELMIKLRDLEGVSSIFVTHDLKAAFTLASKFAVVRPGGEVEFLGEDGKLCLINTRFAMVRDGKILFEGTDEKLRNFEDQYIKEFLA
ncbi:MAG TPA: ATP-binding cassette domain-containing protein [Acidobacteriota bacterium]|jgi:phospholipid/cholesterol/gamma-HCH transport system ATP-binding protein|nr:ATP-binding cassette domain-containing protein [Acidobacteriota bacterium]